MALKGHPSRPDLPGMTNLARATATCRVRRLLSALLIGAAALVPTVASHAREEQSVSELKADLDIIQRQLDASVARIERLRTHQNELLFEVGRIEIEIGEQEAEKQVVEDRAVATARRLYMRGGDDTLDVLLAAKSFTDLMIHYEATERIAEADRMAFTALEEQQQALRGLQRKLSAKTVELAGSRMRIEEESALLQTRFEEATAKYEKLKEKLAAARLGGIGIITADGMTCPIAAPNSFIDSWGYPRPGGRTHEGTDMMAAAGAPVVAITAGRITFAGVGTTAGNWVILSGDDGNSYYYMHNRENLVTGGRVRVGQQIATVGDTGNAIGGPPHVHFEFHPGGGGPVNPYSLLAKVCRAAP
jgi:murein DD-endopeptidase MepM/ murein hydrolase activator NlpD